MKSQFNHTFRLFH